MDERQERQIARGLRQGDGDAWAALYEAYFDRVWRSVARMMGPHAGEVADVVQETFLAAARSAGKYDPERGSLWLWLGGIARNQVAVHFRKRRSDDRRRAAAGTVGMSRQWVEWLADGGDSPTEALATAELAGLVRATLSELPSDYEVLLTAKYCDGVTVDEIARLNHCSSVAVRSKLARARRAFRDAFGRVSGGCDDGPAGACDES